MSGCVSTIQMRRGSTAEWTAADPVLAEGELAYDETTGDVYVGDGVTPWSGLTPINGGGGGAPGVPTQTIRAVYGSKENLNWSTVASDTVGNESSYLASTNAQNNFVAWDFAVPVTDDYSLVTSYHAFTNRGVASVRIDGVEVGTINMHAASLQDGLRSTIAVPGLTAGIHELRYVMATVGAGGGFVGTIEAFGIVRQA